MKKMVGNEGEVGRLAEIMYGGQGVFDQVLRYEFHKK